VGGEEFRQELLAQARVGGGPNDCGSERWEWAGGSGASDYGRGGAAVWFSPIEIDLLPGGSGIKNQLARRLRRETTMGLKWIAEELGTGSWKYLSNLLSKEPHISNQREFKL